MEVGIVIFPETKVAVVEHRGAPELEHATALMLIAWKKANHLMDPLKHRSYGVHYTDSRRAVPDEHRVDFCLSYDEIIAPNPYGVKPKVIPGLRCAQARDIGSRLDNKAAAYLVEQWLPKSGETRGDFPMFFHYVNVGPNLRQEEMITDVYLPLKP